QHGMVANIEDFQLGQRFRGSESLRAPHAHFPVAMANIEFSQVAQVRRSEKRYRLRGAKRSKERQTLDPRQCPALSQRRSVPAEPVERQVHNSWCDPKEIIAMLD